MPLALATGPSLDVWTDTEETEDWFAQVFVDCEASNGHTTTGHDSAIPWWKTKSTQSHFGILLEVNYPNPISTSPGLPRITEVLLYGTTSLPATTSTLKSTLPSASLASDAQTPCEGHTAHLRIHALPLSSDLLPKSLPSPVATSPQDKQPPPQNVQPPASPPSPKRRKISTLFDDATTHRKLARRKGGGRVSQAAGRLEIQTHGWSPIEGLQHSPHALPSGLSRSSNASSLRANRENDSSLPLGVHSSLTDDLKRSGLSHVDSAGAAQVKERDACSEPAFETKNREALSRVVMAGLRVHGLQQRKRRVSRSASEVRSSTGRETPSTGREVEETDEFKLVYHQTFRGACFALVRRSLSRQTWGLLTEP